MWRIILISIAAFPTTPIAMAENAGKSTDESSGSKDHLAAPPAKWESRVTDTFFPRRSRSAGRPTPPVDDGGSSGGRKGRKKMLLKLPVDHRAAIPLAA